MNWRARASKRTIMLPLEIRKTDRPAVQAERLSCDLGCYQRSQQSTNAHSIFRSDRGGSPKATLEVEDRR